MPATTSRGYSTRCPLTRSAIAGGRRAKHASHRPAVPVGEEPAAVGAPVAGGQRQPGMVPPVDDQTVPQPGPVRHQRLLGRVPVQRQLPVEANGAGRPVRPAADVDQHVAAVRAQRPVAGAVVIVGRPAQEQGALGLARTALTASAARTLLQGRRRMSWYVFSAVPGGVRSVASTSTPDARSSAAQ